MKNIKFFVVAAICVATTCASAQNVVVEKAISLDENGGTELKNFFAQHPTDTIRTSLNGKAVKLYVQNGNVCYDVVSTVATSAPAVKTTAKVERVENTEGDGLKVTRADGSQMSFKRKPVNEISTGEGIAYLNDSLKVFDDAHTNCEGEPHDRVQIGVSGGINCVSGSDVNPEGGAFIGYENRYVVAKVGGSVSRAKFGETTETPGAHYTILKVYVYVGYKVWKALNTPSYFAVGVQGGYVFTRTNHPNAAFVSANYAVECGISAQYVRALNRHWGIGLEVGFGNYPSLNLGVHEYQKFNFGFGVSVLVPFCL